MSRRKKNWIVALCLAASLLLSAGGAGADTLAGAAASRFLGWWQAVLSWALPSPTVEKSTVTDPQPPDSSTTNDDGSCTDCTDIGTHIDPNG